jgi:hypothetical protein
MGNPGCSRVVSPPNRSIFNRDIGDQYDWEMATRSTSPESQAPSRRASNPLGETEPAAEIAFSPHQALEHQFAHSMRVPEKTPPRLIPITPIEFPGDNEPGVTQTGLTDHDLLSSRATLAASFADATDAASPEPAEKQAVLLTSPAAKTAQPQNTSNDKVATSAKPEPPPEPTCDTIRLPANTSHLISNQTTPAMNGNIALEPAPASPSQRVDHAASTPEREFRTTSNLDYSRKKELNQGDLAMKFDPAEFSAARRQPLDKELNHSGASSNLGTELATPKDKLPTEDHSAREATCSQADCSAVDETVSLPKEPNLSQGTNIDEGNHEAQVSKAETAPQSSDTDALMNAGIAVDNSAFVKVLPVSKTVATRSNHDPSIADLRNPAVSHARLDLTPITTSETVSPKELASTETNPASISKVALMGSETLGDLSNSSDFQVLPNADQAHFSPLETMPEECPLDPCKTESRPETCLFLNLIPPTLISKLSESPPAEKFAAGAPDEIPLMPPSPLRNVSPSPLSDGVRNPSATQIPSEFPLQSSQQTAHLSEWEEPSELRLANCQFCTQIKGFGQVTPFPAAQFSSSQRTLVYCEVENFETKVLNTVDGEKFITRFRGRYEILDSSGKLMQSGQFPEIEDMTNRRRKDFYLYFPMTLKNLPEGLYHLKLSIQDSTFALEEKSETAKIAEDSIRFSVKENK